MAIDIRATVSCSLGTLISGNISDDYIQGNGLVKVRGSCELNGVVTPKPGAVVTFSYTRNGVTTAIPRKLRVLSSFADPFRRTTKVELGCKLTYLESLGPKPSALDPDEDRPATETGRRQQCLNGYIEYPKENNEEDGSVIPVPISASGIMAKCLGALGISASGNPLTNRFMIDEFDFSSGYVQVLSDLLLSEGYFGYLDATETLQVISLHDASTTGPRITKDDVVDINGIGVGELPGEAVYVRYQSLRLVEDKQAQTEQEREEREQSYAKNSDDSWEFESQTGEPEPHTIRYVFGGQTYEETYDHTPYTETRTTFGKNDGWDNDTCVIYSSKGEGADLSNKPIRRLTRNRRMLAEAAGSYVAQLRSADIGVNARLQANEEIETLYKYNEDGEQVQQIERRYLPEFAWVGSLDISAVYQSGVTTSWYVVSSDLILISEVITDTEIIKSPRPRGMYLAAGEEWLPTVLGTKTTTTTRVNWALSLGGQQAIAEIKENSPFSNADQLAAFLNSAKENVVTEDVQVSTQRQYGLPAGEVRPPASERLLQAYSAQAGEDSSINTETVEELAFAAGGTGGGLARDVVFTMPYQSDDYLSASGLIVRGDAAIKAQRYGTIQNRLLLGNRYGVNLQLHPKHLPAAPFAPIYLKSDSLTVQYRANGMSWAFSSDGVVASVDALYWGVAGGSGVPWVPVAPGVTTFPDEPTVTVNPSTGVAEATVAAVIPPWNETLTLLGRSRTRCDVVPYPYALSSTTELGALVTRTRALYALRLEAGTGAFGVTGQQANPNPAETGNLVLTGHPATLLHHYVLQAKAGAFFLTPEPDNSYFENWALQHYSFESELQPVWWAD